MSSKPGEDSGGLLSSSKRYEGSSDLVHLRYHMGPVLSSPINLYLIWYGPWPAALQAPLRDFLLSLSDPAPPPPSAAQWWSTVALYRPDRGQRLPPRRRRRRGAPPGSSPRRLPLPPCRAARHRRRPRRRFPPRRPRSRRLPRPHRPRGHRPGLLPRRLRLPLLHLRLPGRSHPPLRLGRPQRRAVPRLVRLPLRRPHLHGRRRGHAPAQRRRWRRRHGQRARA
ncbi:hypothetical protein MUK42_02834 [Musa troglodytarum]|uniref:Uncharacterized protein n=2 Tax=Musa troglodytarum TaxID=320322 RepID=A0A9E7HJV4_9LILI|nr:hypothetical protein MUK42_02834 [Musa troglodytarum]